ncbi:VOC family protein [soil metagenome]
MTCRLVVVAIDARDPVRVASFWAAALGWEMEVDHADGGVSLTPSGLDDRAAAACPTIDVLPVPEEKAVKNRLHLDLRADGTTQDEEVERLLALGARRVDVGQAQEATWVVLADPEGNEFCVLQKSVQAVRAPAPRDQRSVQLVDPLDVEVVQHSSLPTMSGGTGARRAHRRTS